MYIFFQTGKKPRTREGAGRPGIPQERHITIPEVSPERKGTLGSSPHHHVEAKSG